jgi:hypothetical protein
LNEIIEEQGRCVSDIVPDQIEIGSLQCPLSQKPVAKSDHQFPILSGIIIADRRNLSAGDAAAGGSEQGRIQFPLGSTGIGRRKQFRSRKVDFKKFIGHQQAAAGVAIDEMVAAGEPEIVHQRSPRMRFMRG